MVKIVLDARGRIIRAKIKLGKEQPFFAFLLSYLKIQEFDKQIKNIGFGETMAVDTKGNLFYNPDFIKSLSDEVLKGVLCHEVLHLSFSHFIRKMGRDLNLWNVTADIMVNYVLLQNGFELPDEGLIPRNNEMNFPQFNSTIKDIDKKTAEQIYDELYKIIPKKGVKFIVGKPNGKGKSNGKGKTIVTMDGHIYSNKKLTKKEKAELQKNWTERVVEASQHAKQRGKFPAGVDRLIGRLLNSKVSWQTLLRKYITNEIISDFSWRKPNKKRLTYGYLPSTIKENVEIVIAVDTSGSIGPEELTQFISEIVAIVRSTDNLKAHIVECDAAIHQELEVSNGNIKKILDMKPKGGGGTAFQPVLDYMADKRRNLQLLVYLTDGYGEKVKGNFPFDILWVLTKDGSDELIKDSGRVIKMD